VLHALMGCSFLKGCGCSGSSWSPSPVCRGCILFSGSFGQRSSVIIAVQLGLVVTHKVSCGRVPRMPAVERLYIPEVQCCGAAALVSGVTC